MDRSAGVNTPPATAKIRPQPALLFSLYLADLHAGIVRLDNLLEALPRPGAADGAELTHADAVAESPTPNDDSARGFGDIRDEGAAKQGETGEVTPQDEPDLVASVGKRAVRGNDGTCSRPSA